MATDKPTPGKPNDAGNRMHPYATRVLEQVSAKYPWETEFLQAVHEVLACISPVLLVNPRYEKLCILERLVEPERTVSFRVPWTDDRNAVHVTRGYRVQFSSVLGPYKGGIRFHPSVTESSLKFLGFEQTFKNALTGQQLGGGKGGASFQTRGRSDQEIMRFCQAFMTELSRHIDANTDIPAGDIGVGSREIGFMFGQYKRLANRFEGVLTGKGVEWGGSLMRPEATGYGVAYFADRMLGTRNESLAGKTVAVSGFGNVAWGAVEKVTALGAKVVTLSGPDGFVHDPAGVSGEKIEYMLTLRAGGGDAVKGYADHFGVEFHPGRRPWVVPCDVALPCAIQNELGEEDARQLIANKCQCVAEGANMPTTPEAVELLQQARVLFAPGKAANAGGVACSGLEMAQNSSRQRWPATQVDEALGGIMRSIHDKCLEAASLHGREGDYVAGANIAGFLRVAEAMIDQGIC